MAHHEHLAADVGQREIRPAGRVVEDPELGHPAGEGVRDGFVVVGSDPQQHDKARTDRPDHLIVDAHLRARRPLEQRPHGLRDLVALLGDSPADEDSPCNVRGPDFRDRSGGRCVSGGLIPNSAM